MLQEVLEWAVLSFQRLRLDPRGKNVVKLNKQTVH